MFDSSSALLFPSKQSSLDHTVSEPTREVGHVTGTLHGTMLGRKYEEGGSRLLRSSADIPWQGSVAAEVRRHTDLHCPSFVQPVNEVAIAIAGTAIVNRRADGPEQNFILHPGVACVCPRGVEVNYLHIAQGQLDMLHLYLPMDLYGNLRTTVHAPSSALIYCGGFQDPLIKQVAVSISDALQSEGPAGRLLIDSLGMALAAWMLQRYTRQSDSYFTDSYRDAAVSKGLDQVRLARVLEFMTENFDKDISLQDLADVACLSVYHFSRAFKQATGTAPVQYISNLRISKCKAMLVDPQKTIEDIAFSTGFSSGANFARTFKKSVGLSPSQYRTQSV